MAFLLTRKESEAGGSLPTDSVLFSYFKEENLMMAAACLCIPYCFLMKKNPIAQAEPLLVWLRQTVTDYEAFIVAAR